MITKEVYVSRTRDFLHEIARLNKKAARIGVSAIQVEELGVVSQTRTVVVVDEDGNEDARTYPVDCTQFRLTLPEPVDCPWLAIVKITPVEGKSFAEPMPAGTNADADAYKAADSQNCDHCHTRRARLVSYVVRNKADGRQLQLGRNCFEDYVGKDTLAALEFQALIMASVGGDEDGFWGDNAMRQIPVVGVEDCVAYAEMLFRTKGWQNNVKNQYSGEIEVEGTHRIAARRVKQFNDQQFPEAAQIMADVTADDRAEAVKIIARMQETETTDEFGQTLKNVSDYQWIPAQKASVACYMGQFLRNIDRRVREAELNGKRVYVGTVGQRETFSNLICVRCPSFESDYGRVYVNTFEDADGNILIWKTGSYNAEVGDKVTLMGTVKDHSEYRGTKQTILSRCKEVFPPHDYTPVMEGDWQSPCGICGKNKHEHKAAKKPRKAARRYSARELKEQAADAQQFADDNAARDAACDQLGLR